MAQPSTKINRQFSPDKWTLRHDKQHRCRIVRPRASAVRRESQAPSDAQLLTDAPNRFIGPIRVCEIEGKGRGFVATEAIRPGQLLLCCQPLGVVTGPQQTSLSVEQLQRELASNYSNHTHWWLYQLYDGSDNSTHTALQFGDSQHQQQPELGRSSNTCHGEPQYAVAYAAAAAVPPHLTSSSNGCQQQQHNTSSSSSSSNAQPVVTDATLQRLMDVVRYNAYGDHHDDLAAAALVGTEPVSLVGLWPEFSLLNHSCVPNAINWVLPGASRAMLVRAARHIQPGSEVTISYLGAPQLLPLDVRQEALSTAFGFNCSCPRCRAEEDVPHSLEQLLQDIVSRAAQSFVPRLRRAMQAGGDLQQLQDIRRQAAAMMTLLYQQLRQHMIHPELREQLLSSCYNCLEVIADADTALGDKQATAASLTKCLKAAAAVTPGSDLHVIVASKLAALQQELHGEDSPQAEQAWAACFGAHHIRYGQLEVDVVQQLAELNRKLYV